jgi:REP-associated tyrosine transposase
LESGPARLCGQISLPKNACGIRAEILLDQFVIMPDHVHGIVVISDAKRTSVLSSKHLLGRAPRSLGSLVAGFKAAATKRINGLRCTPGAVVWQSNYHEHVIRNESELAAIRTYIRNNPIARTAVRAHLFRFRNDQGFHQ